MGSLPLQSNPLSITVLGKEQHIPEPETTTSRPTWTNYSVNTECGKVSPVLNVRMVHVPYELDDVKRKMHDNIATGDMTGADKNEKGAKEASALYRPFLPLNRLPASQSEL